MDDYLVTQFNIKNILTELKLTNLHETIVDCTASLKIATQDLHPYYMLTTEKYTI